MTTTHSYDPAYCLAEHLTYFQDNVAFDINASDFDDVFGDPEAMYLPAGAPHESVCSPELVHVPNPLSSNLKAMPPVTISSAQPESPTSVREILSDQVLPPIVVELEQKIVTQSAGCFNAVSDDETNSVGENESVYSSAISTSDPLQIVPVVTESEFEPLSSTIVPLAPVPSQSTSQSTNKETATKKSQTTKKASRKRKSVAEDGPQVRRERNRLHAKKSRERKREFNQCLQESVDALKEENEWLLSVINKQFKVLGEPSAPSLQQTHEEDFIAGLRNPANRVLSDDTLEDLRSYFN